MAFAQHDLAPKSWELGSYTLILSALGILAKVLRIDVAGLDILGVKMGAESVVLIPGFIGLALGYTFLAYCAARLENVLVLHSGADTKALIEEFPKDRSLRWVSYVALAFSAPVYIAPLVLGVFATTYLWPDSVAVVKLALVSAPASAEVTVLHCAGTDALAELKANAPTYKYSISFDEKRRLLTFNGTTFDSDASFSPKTIEGKRFQALSSDPSITQQGMEERHPKPHIAHAPAAYLATSYLAMDGHTRRLHDPRAHAGAYCCRRLPCLDQDGG
jgi:hypothetical protein